MKTMTLAKLGVAALMTVVLVGCAGMGGPNDEELIGQVLDTWKAGIESQNLDQVMSTYSDNYENSDLGGKEGLRDFLQNAVDMGYLDDAEVDLTQAETKIADDGMTATVYPVDLSGPAGSFTLEFTLGKEDGSWLITASDAG